MTTQTELRNYVWQACTAIRNEHRDVKKYVEYTAILLFFKFYDDLYETLPIDIQGLIPEEYRWNTLRDLDIRGFAGFHPQVLIRLRDFFEKKLWRGKDTFGIIFENFQFDIKHDEVLGRALISLDRINFAGINYDQKGDIYEFLIGKMADAGVKGEFFTPRSVVNMIVCILRPQFGLRIWDPACGTGGFLSRAFEEMLASLKDQYNENDQEYEKHLEILRRESIYGNETEAVSARLARMNMLLRGDGHSTILEFNSLDQLTYKESPLEIRGKLEANPIPQILAEGGFDLIMGNPPYGGSQAVCDVSGQFKPWQKSKKPEANFLQVMMHALKPGGRCGVVMPEGVLFRRDETKIREQLLESFHLEAVIGLFKGAFEFADVKACVLFFRKPTKQEKWQGTKEVWIAETQTFADISSVPRYLNERNENNLGRLVSIEEIRENKFILRPSKYLKTSSQDNTTGVLLSDLFNEVKNTIQIEDAQIYQQVTVKLYGKGAVLRQKVLGAEIGTKRQKVTKTGDLIVSKIDARHGAFALIPSELDGAVVTQDFPLFRPKSDQLLPELLEYYLRFGSLDKRLDPQGTTNRQRVASDDILSLALPCPDKEMQQKLLNRLDTQRAIVERSSLLLEDVHKLNWLDDEVFFVQPDDLLASSFEALVEDASEYIDPSAEPETEWQLYSLTNVSGVSTGEIKLGREFTRGRRYKKLVCGAITYDTRRVNVGSVGIMPAGSKNSIISPYRVVFKCKEGLDPRFTLYLLKSPLFRKLVNDAQVGAVRDELFFQNFTEIEIPIPIPSRQQEIVQMIDAQLAAYDQIRVICEQAEATIRKIIQRLFMQVDNSSIMQRADIDRGEKNFEEEASNESSSISYMVEQMQLLD